MEKIGINTALAIVVIATAVVLIGGLAVIPTATTMQSASAEGCGVGGCSNDFGLDGSPWTGGFGRGGGEGDGGNCDDRNGSPHGLDCGGGHGSGRGNGDARCGSGTQGDSVVGGGSCDN